MPKDVLVACSAAALSLAVSTDAKAEPPPPSTRAPRASTPTAGSTRSAGETYRLPLALAYGVPLSLEVATWFVDSSRSDAYSAVALAGMLVTPFIVHAAHDNVRAGWTAELGILGSLVGGAVAGAAILVASGKDVCEDCDDGVGETGSQILTGGAVGAALGYATWAVIDTALHARVPQTDSSRALGPELAGSKSPSIVVVPHSDAGRPRALVTGFSLILSGEL
jgi:hypothetical protein